VRLLQRIYRPGHRYKKCGVMLTALALATTARADLFDDRDREKERRLMQAVDAVNARFGRGAVFFAGAAAPKAGVPRWTTKAAMRSPRYTTRFDELPVVRA
jgi:DNA polymerase V